MLVDGIDPVSGDPVVWPHDGDEVELCAEPPSVDPERFFAVLE